MPKLYLSKLVIQSLRNSFLGINSVLKMKKLILSVALISWIGYSASAQEQKKGTQKRGTLCAKGTQHATLVLERWKNSGNERW